MCTWRSLIVLIVIATTSSLSAPECLLPLPSSQTQRVITRAEAVYVFPYTDNASPYSNNSKGWLDKKHLRLLSGSAREKPVAILEDSRNWAHPSPVVVEPPALRSVGIVFRTATDDVVLFFNPISVGGTFRGCVLYGALRDQPRGRLEKWKQRYAHSEVESKIRSNRGVKGMTIGEHASARTEY